MPAAFADLDKRVLVRISTNIAIADDPKGIRARRAVEKLNGELEAYWRGMRDGQSAEAQRRYDEARRRARAMGFDYAPTDEIAERSIEEIVRRVTALRQADVVDKEEAVSAALGGEDVPAIRITTLLAEYEALQRASLSGMSPDQIRRWRNPKSRAITNLLEVVEDKPLTKLTRGDALDFRNHWQNRVIAEGLDIGTANKDIGHLNKMVRTIDNAHRLGLPVLFGGLRIEGEKTGQRTAFPAAFVQANILKEGALDDLNAQARHVVYLVSETGLRLSEAVNLDASTIHLGAEIPHISVRGVGRRMKTEHSARDIPLVGVALEVMKLNPNGFPRYRDKGASLSALVNKVFSAKELRPKDGQSLYSLRHTFEDRLTAVEAPEKVIASLMGHKWIRPKYGAGPSLHQLREWLSRIAFVPPGRV